MTIDLNCDMGESFGRYTLGADASILPLITSANIACGLHAGDPSVMRLTIRLAKHQGVSIGAHPGWPDLQGFGRREMSFSAEETESFVLYQVGALAAFCRAEQAELRHVKPHGALYNQAARDPALASAIARAVRAFDPHLVLVGLAGSALIDAGLARGLRVAHEAFPDRRYNPDGTLMSRAKAEALITDPQEVATHAVGLAREGLDFRGRHVEVDTLCLHGDHAHAAENARLVRLALENSGIEVRVLER